MNRGKNFRYSLTPWVSNIAGLLRYMMYTAGIMLKLSGLMASPEEKKAARSIFSAISYNYLAQETFAWNLTLLTQVKQL